MFVGVAVLCEFYTMLTIIKFATSNLVGQFNPGPDGKCTICHQTEEDHDDFRSEDRRGFRVEPDGNKYCYGVMWRLWGKPYKFLLWSIFCFVASVGCSVGKLFPPDNYFCSNDRCVKVVHNAVMTFVYYPFDSRNAYMLFLKAMIDPMPSRVELCFKIVQVFASIGYLMYDTFKAAKPLLQGPGASSDKVRDDRDDFNRLLEVLCAMIACGLLLMTAASELFILWWVTYRKPQFQEVQEVPTTSPGDGQGV